LGYVLAFSAEALNCGMLRRVTTLRWGGSVEGGRYIVLLRSIFGQP